MIPPVNDQLVTEREHLPAQITDMRPRGDNRRRTIRRYRARRRLLIALQILIDIHVRILYIQIRRRRLRRHVITLRALHGDLVLQLPEHFMICE